LFRYLLHDIDFQALQWEQFEHLKTYEIHDAIMVVWAPVAEIGTYFLISPQKSSVIGTFPGNRLYGVVDGARKTNFLPSWKQHHYLKLRYLNIVKKRGYTLSKYKIGRLHVKKQTTGTNTAVNNLNVPFKKNDKKQAALDLRL